MSKLLIVDDAEYFRMELMGDLGVGNHQVLQAGDGKQGLEILEKEKGVQLIICDVNMPVMDGFSMCQNVRENPSYASYVKIPIIMLTTEASPEVRAKGEKLGIDMWLVKPYNPKKLLMVIDKIIQQGSTPL